MILVFVGAAAWSFADIELLCHLAVRTQRPRKDPVVGVSLRAGS